MQQEYCLHLIFLFSLLPVVSKLLFSGSVSSLLYVYHEIVMLAYSYLVILELIHAGKKT